MIKTTAYLTLRVCLFSQCETCWVFIWIAIYLMYFYKKGGKQQFCSCFSFYFIINIAKYIYTVIRALFFILITVFSGLLILSKKSKFIQIISTPLIILAYQKFINIIWKKKAYLTLRVWLFSQCEACRDFIWIPIYLMVLL